MFGVQGSGFRAFGVCLGLAFGGVWGVGEGGGGGGGRRGGWGGLGIFGILLGSGFRGFWVNRVSSALEVLWFYV